MFSDFLRRLTEPASDPLQEDDARLALAALLVRVARTRWGLCRGRSDPYRSNSVRTLRS